jgi:hypothetical protein
MPKYRYTFDNRGRVLDVTDTDTGKRVLAMRYDATRQDAADAKRPHFRQESADGVTPPSPTSRRVFHSAAQIRDYLSLPPAIQPPQAKATFRQSMRQDAKPRTVTSSAELRRILGFKTR